MLCRSALTEEVLKKSSPIDAGRIQHMVTAALVKQRHLSSQQPPQQDSEVTLSIKHQMVIII